LFYTWLGLRVVNGEHQLTFDPDVLLEQLLVADAVMEGTRPAAFPRHGNEIMQAFPEHKVFYTPFIRGDANRSGHVDLSDAVFTLQYLFLGGGDDRCLVAMDTDDSSALDLSDALSTLSFLFLQGPAPPLPFPACGLDPSIFDLWCAETAPACRQAP
jgi:hypothetical protein